MKQFFKFMFASMLGTFLSTVIIFLIAFFSIVAIIAGSIGTFNKMDKVDMKDPAILKVQLDDPIRDRGGQKQFKFNGPGNFSMFEETGLNEIIDALRKARNDERIEGVVLKLNRVVTGMATMKEIRDALERFRDSSDKFILAYGKGYSQKNYYLASTADRIGLYPEGSMMFKGLSSEVTFFKGMLDKLKVDMQVVRGSNNKYKSAVEPFTRKEMSKASRKQMEAYLGDLWNVYLSDVSDARDLSKKELNRVADSLSVRSASDAVEHGFVDGLMYPDEFDQRLRDSLNLEGEQELPYITLEQYCEAEVPDQHWTGSDRDPKKEEGAKKDGQEGKIGVVYAMGGIQTGENGQGVLGSKTTSKAIRKCREDSSIEAVVMRVNSPGGSALASDRIWREVKLTREEKPFIVSMGDVAASGGYYISCAGDRIFADPNTITGSIGVFGLIPHTGDLFEEELGISFDQVKTNAYADMGSPSNPLEKRERRMIEEQIDTVYQQFLKRVAEGRGMRKSKVDSVARGRVWSGKDAKRVGLVDELGGMKSAFEHASQQAGLQDPERETFPEREDPLQQLLTDLNIQMKEGMLDATLGNDMRFYRKYRYLQSVLDMKGIQMRMPYHVEVK